MNYKAHVSELANATQNVLSDVEHDYEEIDSPDAFTPEQDQCLIANVETEPGTVAIHTKHEANETLIYNKRDGQKRLDHREATVVVDEHDANGSIVNLLHSDDATDYNEDDETPEQRHEMLINNIIRDFELISRVLNDVLSLDRIALGMLEPSIEPFRLDQTIKDAVEGFRPQAVSQNLFLKLKADPEIEKHVLMGDSSRLRQLIGNLVSNSLKFTQQGGVTVVTKLEGFVDQAATPNSSVPSSGFTSAKMSKVTTPMCMDHPDKVIDYAAVEGIATLPAHLDTSPSSPQHSSPSMTSGTTRPVPVSNSRRAVIHVEVRDTGLGFSAEDVKDCPLFQEYQQTREGKKQGERGSGLGLSLCRKFIEVFGGRLGVSSVKGKGSTFW